MDFSSGNENERDVDEWPEIENYLRFLGMVYQFKSDLLYFYKLECVVKMVVGYMLPHAESGPNDHQKDAPPFNVYL